MDETAKEALISQFQSYLEQSASETAVDAEQKEPADTTDLFSLYTELASLRTEVKQESRQFKNALDQFRSGFETLESSYGRLADDAMRRQTEIKALLRELLRPVFLALVELRDRIEEGLNAVDEFRPSLLGRLAERETRIIAGLREGQAITLRRLDQTLSQYGVRPLETLGHVLDPHTMRAVEVENRLDQANGIVTSEFRKGFLWEEELLRVAEVRVNKQSPSS
jgi:Molecular chaperone GrpE (heat shock protein)